VSSRAGGPRPEPTSRTPRISVVLAVHNGEPFLGEAIGSILGQTFADFELLVVNDGSTDGSRQVAASFDDPRLRILDNPRNLGLTPSLNRGLEAARGEFVARMDADDISRTDRFERQVAFLDANPAVALVGSQYRQIDANGNTSGGGPLPLEHLRIRWGLMFHCPIIHASVLWRREAVRDAVGGYDPAFGYAMDWDLWNRTAARFEVANLPEPLVQYRVGSHTMTSNHPGVAGEMAAARFGAIQAVFGAEEADEWIDRHKWILPFDEGWPAHFGPREVERSVLTVRRLYRRFIERLDVPEAERPRCHAFIRSWMSRRLVRGARRAEREGHPDLGPLLVAEAVRLEPDCVFSPNFGRYLLARLPVNLRT
jgi:glycosyltransferase involved in cell wall biosynthesis